MTERPRVVIVGAGFGGLAAARGLARTPVDVTLIDQRNYHLFQPLLYQVATAGLSPADIAWPIRRIVRHQRNVRVLLGHVTAIDSAASAVVMDGHRIAYDTLILATGARHGYFGHDEWEPHAPGLKTIDDATRIRRRILLAFERAETTADPDERSRLLTFAIIGAGPTGLELAGAIAELARRALAADFRNIDPRLARILLVEAGPRVLPAFAESLSGVARRSLTRLGVEVRTDQAVTACDADGIMLGDERVPAATVIWAAGVAASPAARWLAVEGDRAGRLPVAPDRCVAGHPAVFAIGDTALAKDRDGNPLPGIAQVAKTTGCLRRPRHRRPRRRPTGATAIPLSPLRQPRDDRPPRRGDRFRRPAPDRLAGLADLVGRPHLFPDQPAQPHPGRHPVAVALRHVRPRRPADHRRGPGGIAAASPFVPRQARDEEAQGEVQLPSSSPSSEPCREHSELTGLCTI